MYTKFMFDQFDDIFSNEKNVFIVIFWRLIYNSSQIIRKWLKILKLNTRQLKSFLWNLANDHKRVAFSNENVIKCYHQFDFLSLKIDEQSSKWKEKTRKILRVRDFDVLSTAFDFRFQMNFHECLAMAERVRVIFA